MELVSIGMPVYNDKAFLPGALDSLLKQTYTNFELIISDDCSSDGSRDICLEIAKYDTRIRYIRQSKNIGISPNMEFLLMQAKGMYFMWAANDDLWHPDFIKELVDGLKKNEDCVAAFCGVQEIDEDNVPLKLHDPQVIDYSGNSAEIRIRKLIKVFYDGFGYGLFKRDKIIGVRFPVWWWVNKKCPYNNIYPTLCFYLTKGNYVSCGQVPLWYNRMKDEKNIHHKIPYHNSFMRGYLSNVLRKLNLVIFSLREIRRAGGSQFLTIKLSIPMYYHWFFRPVFFNFISYWRRFRKGGIKFW